MSPDCLHKLRFVSSLRVPVAVCEKVSYFALVKKITFSISNKYTFQKMQILSHTQ